MQNLKILQLLKGSKHFFENQSSFKLLNLQTDNAKEFFSLQSLLNENGFHRRLICPHTNEHNGSAKMKHRHKIDMGFTLLANASIPIKFWVDYRYTYHKCFAYSCCSQ